MSDIDKGANWWMEQCYRSSLSYAEENRGDLVPLIECWFVAPRLECEDGFSMSVQASASHYCTPKESHSYPYKKVEVGYPNTKEDCLLPYAENEDDPTGTVYAYVPVELVDELIEKHGGIAIEPYDAYEVRYSIEGEYL